MSPNQAFGAPDTIPGWKDHLFTNEIYLSSSVRDVLLQEGEQMVTQLLSIARSTRSVPWELVQRKNRISIFKNSDQTTIHSPCNTHAESTAHGELTDIAKWNVTSTTDSFNELMQMISGDFVEGKILANLLTPTESDPYEFIGLRWASFKTSIPTEDDYNMILLESSKFTVDASGQRIACSTLKSVKSSIVDKLVCIRQDSHSLRTLPLTGFTFQATEIPRRIKFTYSCYFATPNNFPNWAVNIGMQVEVEQRIQGRIRFFESCRAREATAAVTMATQKHIDDDLLMHHSSRNVKAVPFVGHVASETVIKSYKDGFESERRSKGRVLSPIKDSQSATPSMCVSTRPVNRKALFEAISQSQKLIAQAEAANALAQHARDMFLEQFSGNNALDQNSQHCADKQHGLITGCGTKSKKFSIEQQGTDCRRIPAQRRNSRPYNLVLTRQEAF